MVVNTGGSRTTLDGGSREFNGGALGACTDADLRADVDLDLLRFGVLDRTVLTTDSDSMITWIHTWFKHTFL